MEPKKHNFPAVRIFLFVLFWGPAFLHPQEKAATVSITSANTSIGISAGMGINVVRASGIVDYINTTSLFSQRVDDWGTAIDFFGAVEIPAGESWEVKLEHSYFFKSYSFIGTNSGTYDLFYSVQSPSVIVQRVIAGNGYIVKFGGGGGYHFGSFRQKVSLYGTESTYSSNGFGMKLELSGQTAFDEHFYGYVGGAVGGEFLGEIGTANGASASDPSEVSRRVKFDYFYAGLQFGLSYFF